MSIDWSVIDLVLLDMDGTLLDLHYDNHFWQQHLALRYAELHHTTREQAADFLAARIAATHGQLHWYCLDAWSEYLQLDLSSLKQETAHLIGFRPHTETFLQRLQQQNMPYILATNAHPQSIELKFQHSDLARYFPDASRIVSAHTLGAAKESIEFWQKLRQQLQFDPERTLFIDDNPAVLKQAQNFGITHLRAVATPDSQRPRQEVAGFINLDYLTELWAD